MNRTMGTFGRVTRAAAALTVLTAAAGALACAPARAVELLVNGNFETGTFAGWTTLLQAGSNGGFFLDVPGSTTPDTNGAGQVYLPNPTDQNNNSLGALLGGNFYAVSASSSFIPGGTNGAGTRVLYQTFTVPLGSITSITLRYNYFVGNPVGPSPVGDGVLDYTSDPILNPRHFARVDLLRGNAANLFSTTTVANGGDLIRQFYQGGGDPSFTEDWRWNGTSANPLTDGPTTASLPNTPGSPPAGFNITANVQAGQTYILRFAEVSNQGPLNFGIDNVSVDFQGSIVLPEPGTLPLMGLAAPGLALVAVRRRRRRSH